MPEYETPPHDIRDRSFEFAVRIVNLCQSIESGPGVEQSLASHLLKSGTSIGAQVEDAHGGHSKEDFTAKMGTACKEARETNYWLRLLAATNIVSDTKLEPLADESNQLVAILSAIVKKSRQQ